VSEGALGADLPTLATTPNLRGRKANMAEPPSDPPRPRSTIPPAADVLALALRRAREQQRASQAPGATTPRPSAAPATPITVLASVRPSTASPASTSARPPSEPAPSRQLRWPVRAAQRAKILVVDDDVVTRRMLTGALARVGDVLTAQDGAEALAIVADEVPNLVITDVSMPHVDGFELTRQLKADPRTTRVPVVFLTVHTGTSEMIAGVNAGARAYIPKPIDLTTFEAKIQKALRR